MQPISKAAIIHKIFHQHSREFIRHWFQHQRNWREKVRSSPPLPLSTNHLHLSQKPLWCHLKNNGSQVDGWCLELTHAEHKNQYNFSCSAWLINRFVVEDDERIFDFYFRIATSSAMLEESRVRTKTTTEQWFQQNPHMRWCDSTPTCIKNQTIYKPRVCKVFKCLCCGQCPLHSRQAWRQLPVDTSSSP